MVNVIYDGEKQTCRIKVGSMIVTKWKKGEVRNIDDSLVSRLLANKDFKLEGSVTKKIKEVKVKKEVKKIVEKPVFDYENALKDELLDKSVELNIETDYTMTVKELQNKFKKYYDERNKQNSME